ncbi:MAG: hypothetical protein O7C75_07895, partial [Verrucomicrobia bacterium]|nr:hypothetical protein [Verrucomicrobiota bacterium]
MHLKFPISGLSLAYWLLALSVTTTAFSQNHTRTSFTKEELIAESFTWLAEDDNRDEIHIYKLSCPACIREMTTVFDQDPKNVGLINFSTYKKADRPLAQALIATTLSHTDERKRAETFGELLNIFVHSSQQFHKDPEQWQSLCLNFWNYDEYEIDDSLPWADALNWMDRQNRINILMDATSYPGSIILKDINPIPPIVEKTYRDQFVFVALSIPWLKYPDVHPVKKAPDSQNHPQQLPVIIINPLKQLGTLDWRKHADTAKKGAFWNFVGDPDISLHPRILEFLAPFFDLPTDTKRREAFAKAIESIAGDKIGSPKSILATIPRVK